MPNPLRLATWIVLAATAAVVAGCGFLADPQLTAERKRLVLAEEPGGAVSIEEARSRLASDPEIVLVGRIGAGAENPFVNGRAAFILSDVPSGDHNHGSDHESDCPFCQRAAAQAATAVVQFVDERGEVVPIDARDLFGVEKGHIVVVRGRGELEEDLDLLSVSADGIFLRQ